MPDRTTRFLVRVENHLATLPDDAARRSFLDCQIVGWEYRRSRFVVTGGDSEPVINPADPPNAADFVATIAALAARRDLIVCAAILQPAE